VFVYRKKTKKVVESYAKENIPAQEAAPSACSRFSSPDVHPRRSKGFKESTSERPPPTIREHEQPRKKDQLEELIPGHQGEAHSPLDQIE
jgi:hypothetical protein